MPARYTWIPKVAMITREGNMGDKAKIGKISKQDTHHY